ncbi:MAG: GntR family transcriptional regulator [Woeseiaceae bacterium]|nr:GntR family transcriptional regulator [Woeseiaceae bacterium]
MMLNTSQLPPSTHSERVYRDLKDAILAGRIAPGEHLVTQRLADQFRVSLTPVRESLRALAKEGLVTFRPHRGAIAVAPKREDFIELYQVRAQLEMLATRLALPRLGDKDFVTLEKTLARNINAATWLSADETFHQTIIDRSANALLRNTLASLADRIRLHRVSYFTAPQRIERSLAEHRAVLAALRRRDPDAPRIMFEHLTSYLEIASEPGK